MTSNPSKNEWEIFTTNHPEHDTVDLLISDISGILRGKRVDVGLLPKVFSEGVALPGSLFGMDITGATVESTGLGFDEGDADRSCRPISGTLAPVTWSKRPAAQVLMSMWEEDGRPFYADPRQVLSKVVQRFSQLGLTPVVAVEMEFYLLDHQRLPSGAPQAPLSPITRERETNTQVYGMSELDDYSAFLDSVATACKAQKIPADTAVAEYAPGQYEINLQHVADPLLACDHAVMLKRLIKGEAIKNGMEATFMAKPYQSLAGSGMHVHISLLDDDGNNVLVGDGLPGSDTMRHIAGGLAATMADFMAVFAPNANSYRRFSPGAYVPLSPAWGVNNRTTSLRIPSGPDHARRIEHRVAGADCNPYLLLAALLSGCHHGIEKQLDPGPLVEGNAYDQFPPSLPSTWLNALEIFAESPITHDYLGDDFCKIYLACKEEERGKFNQFITPLEFQWYLRTV